MKNQLKTILLLGGLSVLLVGIGGAISPTFMYLMLGLAIAMNFGAYFYSDKLVLRMSRARELSATEAPQVHAIVEELSERAQLPKPRVYLIPEGQPNAFATGRNPEHAVVAVTDGILQLLNRRELRGVLAHELSHVKNRDVLVATVAAAIATAVTYIAHVLQFSAFFGGMQDDDEGSPFGALILALVAPLAASLIQMGISRSREYMADATGAEISGDPEGLARALEKLQMGAQRISPHAEPATASLYIVNPFSAGQSLMHLFSTHPPMEERVQRLRAMPRGGRRAA